MASRVDVTAELVLRLVVTDTSVLGIYAFIESPQHHCQGRILQRSCNVLAATPETPVAGRARTGSADQQS